MYDDDRKEEGGKRRKKEEKRKSWGGSVHVTLYVIVIVIGVSRCRHGIILPSLRLMVDGVSTSWVGSLPVRMTTLYRTTAVDGTGRFTG